MLLSRAKRVGSSIEAKRNKMLPNPQTNIKELPADILSSIRDKLDTAPQDLNWRAFINTLVDTFPFNQFEVEQFGLAAQQIDGSPTAKLFVRLSSLDFKVKDLTCSLDILGWESLLLRLKPYERLKLLRCPKEKMILMEGDTLTLKVEAIGFPYPRYQWFNGDKEVECATDNTLIIKNIRVSDEGSYCCRLHNCADLDKLLFTIPTGVTVKENPHLQHFQEIPQQNDERAILYDKMKTQPLRRGMYEAPQILRQSKDISVSSGEAFCLQCTAIGPPVLHYQWYKNGSFLQDSESPEFKVERAEVVDTGSYECRVRNDFGFAKSGVIYVLVKGRSTQIIPSSLPGHGAPLDIIVQPKSCTILKGGSAIFTCGVMSHGPVNYQWFKDGKPLPKKKKVPTATLR